MRRTTNRGPYAAMPDRYQTPGHHLFTVRCLLFAAFWLLAACGASPPAPTATPAPSPAPTRTPAPTPTPTATPVPVQYAVVGKARDDYWSAVERGTQAAEQAL